MKLAQVPAAAGILDAARIVYGCEPAMRALVSAPRHDAAATRYAQLCTLHGAVPWIEARFDATVTVGLIESQRISHLWLTPTMAMRLLRLPAVQRAGPGLRSLRFVALCGGPVASDLWRRLIECCGPVVHGCYAPGALGPVTHIDSEQALRHPGSLGAALAGAAVRIVDTRGRELPDGRIGRIEARSDGAAADQALRGFGDLGRLDSDGHLRLIDREADVIESGGVAVYPSEIGRVLLGLAGVADCAVFGVPDDQYGQCLAAAIEPDGTTELSEPQVQGWLRERIAGYKVPRCVEFHATLPRDEAGRTVVARLREPYWEGQTGRSGSGG